jgi:hypothetical protein
MFGPETGREIDESGLTGNIETREGRTENAQRGIVTWCFHDSREMKKTILRCYTVE